MAQKVPESNETEFSHLNGDIILLKVHICVNQNKNTINIQVY